MTGSIVTDSNAILHPNSDRSGDQIRQTGIVVIIRGQFPIDRLLPIVDTLVEASLCVIEITLNSLDALPAIEHLRTRFKATAHIGAGTVRTPADASRAIEAGAEFLICPNFNPAVIEYAHRHDVLVVPGVMTPSEAENARQAGCSLQKLFPIESIGGLGYLKAIRAPLDDIGFIPTGGVSEKNIAQYRQAGAAAVAIGSALVAESGQSRDDLARQAQQCYRLWHAD